MIKKFVFSLITFAIMAVLLEGFSILVYFFTDPNDLFDHRQSVLSRLNDSSFSDFIVNSGDSELGWTIKTAKLKKEKNCRGSTKTYTYDDNGARTYDGFDTGKTRMIIVGDSYTNGDEVNDNETYVAQLSGILDMSVANQGVGGYGPTQAFLYLKKKIKKYPAVHTSVLAVMYENVYRMMNSYRPVLYSTSSDYTLKPHMADGRIVPHPGKAAFGDLAVFKQSANDAFDNDFWSKPKASFPYTLSLFKAVGSDYFYYRKFQKQLRKLGVPEYSMAFQSEEISENLISLLNSYAVFAEEHGVKAVVIFIPRNAYDTQSASRFLEENSNKLNGDLMIGDVARHASIDWKRFNLREEDDDNICHPSVYGYRMIAEYIADFLRSNKLM